MFDCLLLSGCFVVCVCFGLFFLGFAVDVLGVVVDVVGAPFWVGLLLIVCWRFTRGLWLFAILVLLACLFCAFGFRFFCVAV